MDEMDAAFTDEVTCNLNGSEWTALPALTLASRIICRTSNRLLVGLPLCRDKEYVDLAVKYSMDVSVSAMILMQVPEFLKPPVARFVAPVRATYARAEHLMLGAVEERVRMSAEYGEDGRVRGGQAR